MRPGFIPGLGRCPGERNAPNPIFLPGEFHEQRSLGGYTPQGSKELERTEQLTLLLFSTLKNTSLFGSVHFSPSVMSDSLSPHGPQHNRPLCPSPTPGVYSNSYPSSQWRHPTIWSSVIPFSSCLQSFPASGSFPMSQFFASGGQNIEVSASSSVLPMTIQDRFL